MTDTSDIIIVGGGLSGLSAAYELEQHGVSYTLIEVKPRLGGSVVSTTQNGFIMDGGPFAFPRADGWPTLHALNLSDALYDLATPHKRQLTAFKNGTQTLTDALATCLTGTVIKRMAVTSVGLDDEGPGYRVCLENGLALRARGVVVAVPARYAERIFRTLAPDVSAALDRYHYDHVTRIALGYTAGNRPAKVPTSPPDVIFATLYNTDHPNRVPTGGLLVQTGVRVPLGRTTAEGLVRNVTETMGWGQPDAVFVNYWQEADPLTITGPATRLRGLENKLPDGIALVGGCYKPLTLPQRVEAARDAARQVVATLNS
jgi:protoporphyrinogen oxidase